MVLASKIGWAGMAFVLLAAGILVQAFPPGAAGADANKEEVPAFIIKDEIRKIQETLRNQGHYRGKIDGVFGLRTRDSIREYQSAQKLPITGQVDTRTADGLGVRPGSNWGSYQNAGREAGHGRDRARGEIKKEKPSAGIRRVQRRATNLSRKQVSRATPVKDSRGDGASTQQAENAEPDR